MDSLTVPPAASDAVAITTFSGRTMTLTGYEGPGDPVQHRVIGKGPDELEVALAGLVHSGEDRVYDPKGLFTHNARDTVSGAHAADPHGRVLRRQSLRAQRPGIAWLWPVDWGADGPLTSGVRQDRQ